MTELQRTCDSCPSQWEGENITADGRSVYIRFRWGALSIRLSKPGGDVWAAVDGEEIYYDENNNDNWLGYMSNADLAEIIKDVPELAGVTVPEDER